MSQTIEIKVPDIGDFKDVAVIEVFVKAGDKVEAEQSLITLETDKAAMEVPSPAAGVVKALKVRVGDKVSEGSVILTMESSAQTLTPPSLPLSGEGTPTPSPDKGRAGEGIWRSGQAVFHAKFGEGVIVDLEGSGADARVQVNFRKAGVKWLALEYAKLTAL